MSELKREIPSRIPYRTLAEWTLVSRRHYSNHFAEVTLNAVFTAPSNKVYRLEGFYAGEGSWRVRFNPGEVGRWSYHFVSRVADPELEADGTFEVVQEAELDGAAVHGFLQVTPGQGWGFSYETGESIFLLGDTVYQLFGMAHCGLPVEQFMERRVEQGFNLLRIRVPVSPFHSADGYNQWQQDREIWAWGGSPQGPQFDRFNLDYFTTVDRVMFEAERLGLGVELIMEAWGFEFPFNQRQVFLPEWEDLWIRYLVARYDAFNSLYIWTPLNEYEYYPDGSWGHKRVADRWLTRIAHRIKELGPHGHPVALHNQVREPAFASRFLSDPGAVDIVLLQDWGTFDAKQGWLAANIEDNRLHSLKDWPGGVLLAEYGYERNPALPLLMWPHEFCDPEHTRRGAWRGVMSGWGIIHGFDNSWGLFGLLEEDQPGLVYLLHLHYFFTRLVPFASLRPADDLLAEPGAYADGHRPLILADANQKTFVIYPPTEGQVKLMDANLKTKEYRLSWYNPRSGELLPQTVVTDLTIINSPGYLAAKDSGSSDDWVIILTTV